MQAKDIIDRLLAHNLTQKEIERRSGVAQSTISHLYTGSRGKRTSYAIVSQLSTLLAEVEVEKGAAVTSQQGQAA